MNSMETNLKESLDKYESLTKRVSNFMDKSEKSKAFGNILNRINTIIPDVISSNLHAIQIFRDFGIHSYFGSKFDNTMDLIRFVDSNINEIQDYQNDLNEVKDERTKKYERFRYTRFPKEKVVGVIKHMGVRTYDEKITEPDPGWIYSMSGTYTQFKTFESHRYFAICLNIKLSKCAYFETVNYLVLLYIAVRNELNSVNEELEITGVNKPEQFEQTKEAQPAKVKYNKASNVKTERRIDVDHMKNYFIPSFKGMGNGSINFFDTMIDELKDERSAKEFAQIALMIYNGKKLNNRKPNAFTKWYTNFCEYVGCEKRTYKPSGLKPLPENLKKLFNYL